jgi:hypothetical protein
MTGTVIMAPIRFGVLGAARIADLAIVRQARALREPFASNADEARVVRDAAAA